VVEEPRLPWPVDPSEQADMAAAPRPSKRVAAAVRVVRFMVSS
jgi:hypothetical protein